jgi:hypothetical protein
MEDKVLPVNYFMVTFIALLKKEGLEAPPCVWDPDWVVDCRHVGNGKKALKYLAQYVFRVAIAPSRILKISDTEVLFKDKRSGEKKWRKCKLKIFEFICALYEIIVELLPAKKAPRKKPWICNSCGGIIRWREFIPCPRGAG